ncbi:hypothetical protein QBC37DRAFT_446015 [Rhypophila decipiens]|uniref:Uncharacterized protein n=1 Tax=Rhypophila decipiens TaxID=261697 RepID=A0AAN6Y5B9_9PEZI|nr:hypothetical protein QBC37DRAFT_446015 [Rhypophila decipiens]
MADPDKLIPASTEIRTIVHMNLHDHADDLQHILRVSSHDGHARGTILEIRLGPIPQQTVIPTSQRGPDHYLDVCSHSPLMESPKANMLLNPREQDPLQALSHRRAVERGRCAPPTLTLGRQLATAAAVYEAKRVWLYSGHWCCYTGLRASDIEDWFHPQVESPESGDSHHHSQIRIVVANAEYGAAERVWLHSGHWCCYTGLVIEDWSQPQVESPEWGDSHHYSQIWCYSHTARPIVHEFLHPGQCRPPPPPPPPPPTSTSSRPTMTGFE